MNDKYSAVVDLYIEGHIPKDVYLAKTKQMEDTIEKYKKQLCTLEVKYTLGNGHRVFETPYSLDIDN